MDTKRYCYHSLHEAAHGKVEVVRIDDKKVDVYLPNDGPFHLEIDSRDKRVLVCFEGKIPSGGLPKGSTILRWSHHDIECPVSQVYKRRSEHEEEPDYSVLKDGRCLIIIQKYFVLLKSGRAVFRKYCNKSLQPRYLIVDVHSGYAEFSTSSY